MNSKHLLPGYVMTSNDVAMSFNNFSNKSSAFSDFYLKIIWQHCWPAPASVEVKQKFGPAAYGAAAGRAAVKG